MTLSPKKCDLILVAGGASQRYKAALPKQFELVNGRPLYLWSLDVFLSWAPLDHAIVVVPEDWVEPVKQSFNILKNEHKIQVVKGGTSRQMSAHLGLKKLNDISQNPWVMIHDGARPAITEALLDRIWRAREGRDFQKPYFWPAGQAGGPPPGEPLSETPTEIPLAQDIAGVVPGIPATETIKTILRHGEATLVNQTLPRSELVIVQTPQLLKRALLAQAYGTLQGLDAVDDAFCLEKMGLKIIVVDGDYDNVKVTFNEDKDRVSSWLRKRHP